MNLERKMEKSSIQKPRTVKKEHSFDLPLPILVTGIDTYGNEFQELTEVCSISSQEVILRLYARVTEDSN